MDLKTCGLNNIEPSDSASSSTSPGPNSVQNLIDGHGAMQENNNANCKTGTSFANGDKLMANHGDQSAEFRRSNENNSSHKAAYDADEVQSTPQPKATTTRAQTTKGVPGQMGPKIIQIRLLVRRREAGALIGKRGSNIKRLRESFGSSNFSIPDSGNGPERVVSITGDEQLMGAILSDIAALLLEKSYQKDEQIELKLLIHSWHAGLLIGMGGQSIKKLRNESKAAIKIFEMCCPFSNERVCAIKARPSIVVETLCHIQRLVQDNPHKGAIKPYDALNFDLALVDKYGGFLPEENAQQQQHHHAQPLLPSTQLFPIHSILESFYKQAALVSQQCHQQQHLYQANQQTSSIRPMRRCSTWRAQSTSSYGPPDQAMASASASEGDDTKQPISVPPCSLSIRPSRNLEMKSKQPVSNRYHPYNQKAPPPAALHTPVVLTPTQNSTRFLGNPEHFPREAPFPSIPNRFNCVGPSSHNYQSRFLAPPLSSQLFADDINLKSLLGHCNFGSVVNENLIRSAGNISHDNERHQMQLDGRHSGPQIPCLCMFTSPDPQATPINIESNTNNNNIDTQKGAQSTQNIVAVSPGSASFANNIPAQAGLQSPDNSQVKQSIVVMPDRSCSPKGP